MQIICVLGGEEGRVMSLPNFKKTFKYLLQAFPKLPKSFLLSAATISLNSLANTSAISVENLITYYVPI